MWIFCLVRRDILLNIIPPFYSEHSPIVITQLFCNYAAKCCQRFKLLIPTYPNVSWRCSLCKDICTTEVREKWTLWITDCYLSKVRTDVFSFYFVYLVFMFNMSSSTRENKDLLIALCLVPFVVVGWGIFNIQHFHNKDVCLSDLFVYILVQRLVLEWDITMFDEDTMNRKYVFTFYFYYLITFFTKYTYYYVCTYQHHIICILLYIRD